MKSSWMCRQSPLTWGLTFCLLLLTGCGGEEEKKAPSPPPTITPGVLDETPPEQTPPAGTEPGTGETKPDGTPGTGETGTGEDGTGEKGTEEKTPMPMETAKKPPMEEVPPRPTDVSKWATKDFLSAKKEADRRLLDAVRAMSEGKYGKDARAAGLFKQLLVQEKVPGEKLPDGSEGKPTIIEVPQQIFEELILALGKNQSPEAIAILQDLLVSKIDSTVSRRRILSSVLNVLITYQELPVYEDMLFEMFVNPAKTLDAGKEDPGDPITPARMRQEIAGALTSKMSSSLAVRFAKLLDDPQVSREVAEELETLIIQEKPETVSAKLVLFRNVQAEKRTKTSIESSLVSHTEKALNILLGTPDKAEEPPPPGTLSRPTTRKLSRPEAEVKQEMTFAAECWTPDFIAYINAQIKKAESPEQAPGLVQLLGEIPTPLARFSTSELMAYHAYRGPRIWTAAGMFGRSVSDPAFVIMAKNIYHSSSRRVVRVDPDDPRPAVDQAARDQWKDTMEPLIQGWVRRMYSAAKLADPDEMAAARTTGNFKIVLHKDAHVATEYHLVWPGTAQELIPGVPLGPLEIHYVRLEEEAVPDKIYTHYKRFGGGPSAPKREVRNGYWLDDLGNGSAPKTKRSTDIFISHKPLSEEKAAPGTVNEPKPIPLTVDILTIEVPEPGISPTEK